MRRVEESADACLSGCAEETMNQPEMADLGRFDDDEEVFDNDVGEENTEVR